MCKGRCKELLVGERPTRQQQILGRGGGGVGGVGGGGGGGIRTCAHAKADERELLTKETQPNRTNNKQKIRQKLSGSLFLGVSSQPDCSSMQLLVGMP